MTRHSRIHHRITHRHWQRRRLRRLRSIWSWMDLQPKQVDTHAPSHLLGKKHKDDRRREERRFRQQVRRALTHGEPLPRYRHDWAD
jgi:hypothetical protein